MAKNKSKCKTCKYSTHMNGTIACQYILIEEHSRGCPADKCDKYVKQTKKRRVTFYFGD